MNSSRIALVAAIAAVVSWTLKAVAIGTAGGLDKSPFEGPLYFAGLASFVVAAVALGLAVTRGRPTWVRVLAAAVVAPALALGLGEVVDSLVDAIQPESAARHWAWTEISLWVIAPCVLALTLAVRGREGSPRLTA